MLVDNLEYKINTAPQRSSEWLQARVGYISGSDFHFLLNQKSEAYKKYLYQKAVEIITNKNQKEDTFITKYIQYGIDNEPKARDKYSQLKNMKVEEVGFYYYPTLHIGCSPDGVIREDGGIIEIKCRQPYKHLECNIKVKNENTLKIYDKDSFYQCLFNMYITKANYVDYIQYNDLFDENKNIVIQRIERREEYIEEVNNIIRDTLKDLKNILDNYYGD